MLRISPASILYSNTDKLSGPKLMWDGQENDRNVLCWGEFKLQHVFGKNTIKYQGQNPEANIEKKRLTVCQDRVFFFSFSFCSLLLSCRLPWLACLKSRERQRWNYKSIWVLWRNNKNLQKLLFTKILKHGLKKNLNNCPCLHPWVAASIYEFI